MLGLVHDAWLIGLRCTLPTTLRALALPTVLRLIGPKEPGTMRDARARESIARSEHYALKLGAVDTCLYRSMVRWAALKRAGHAATFVMGLRRDDPDSGHAWVEIDGSPVGEDARPDLIATWRYS